MALDGTRLGDDAGAGAQASNLSAALPWFTHNAFVHYLSPRGLEQFSGGAWGTRDVCQGPVGLLTALGRQDAVRDVLLRVFRAQNARGDWPQAFEFLPPLPESGQQDSHGDVVFWPVLAAGDYLRTTADASLLDETVAFVGDDGLERAATVAEHLRRAVARIAECTVPGSPLPAYGHGDWNDSLQPADPHLAANLVSTWTAVLQTQALRTLAEGLHAVGTPSATDGLATRPSPPTRTSSPSAPTTPSSTSSPSTRCCPATSCTTTTGASSRSSTRPTSGPGCATACCRGSTRSGPTC